MEIYHSPNGKLTYIAIEDGHSNSEFSHLWWCPIVFCKRLTGANHWTSWNILERRKVMKGCLEPICCQLQLRFSMAKAGNADHRTTCQFQLHFYFQLHHFHRKISYPDDVHPCSSMLRLCMMHEGLWCYNGACFHESSLSSGMKMTIPAAA